MCMLMASDVCSRIAVPVHCSIAGCAFVKFVEANDILWQICSPAHLYMYVPLPLHASSMMRVLTGDVPLAPRKLGSG